MANSIITNASASAAIRSLTNIGGQLSNTQSRIESGLRVAKSSDDPAVFSIAQGIRADLAGLSAVKDSLAFGTATLTTANTAGKQISDELAKLKQSILQGQQQGLDATQIQQQVDASLNNIDTYARSATYNGVNLLIDAADPLVSQYGATDFTLNVIQDIQGNTVNVANQAITTDQIGLSGLQLDSGSFEVTFDNTLAIANNNTFTFTGEDGATYTFEFTDGTVAPTTVPVSDDAATTGTNEAVNVIAVFYDPATQPALEGVGALVDAIKGAGFGAKLSNSGELTITGAIDEAAANSTTITGATIGTVTGTTTALGAIDAAIDTVGQKLATLGAATRQVEGLTTFTKAYTDALGEGLGALVDADMAEESARLQALQTRQQLAIQSLTIANQQPQALLGLFR